MTIIQLLEALKPYGVQLSWHEVPGVWQVLLLDYAFAYFYDVDAHAALEAAWRLVQAEKVEE